MPDFESFLTIVLLIIGSSILRRALKDRQRKQEAARQTVERRMARPAPQAFPESAPVLQPKETWRPAEEEPPLVRMAQEKQLPRFELPDEPDPVYEGIQREIQKPRPAPQPRPGILPTFTRDSLVQAIISREVLTRPPSARKMGRQTR